MSENRVVPAFLSDARAKLQARNTPVKSVVDMEKFEKEFTAPDKPSNYAPLAKRQAMEAPMKQVLTFGDLPTKEIDELISRTKQNIAQLEQDAQAVRDIYVKHTTRIIEEMKALDERVQLSMATLRDLKEQCSNQATKLPPPAEEEPAD